MRLCLRFPAAAACCSTTSPRSSHRSPTPLDWEREEIVTSLESAIGPEPNLLADSELHAKKILIPLPVVNSDEMAQLKRLDKARILGGYYRPYVVKGLYQVAGGGKASKSDLTRSLPKSTRPSPTARTSSCSPTVSPTIRGVRSRPCC